eukprot:6198084-Pleurochrysis_carterae.AAC.12
MNCAIAEVLPPAHKRQGLPNVADAVYTNRPRVTSSTGPHTALRANRGFWSCTKAPFLKSGHRVRTFKAFISHSARSDGKQRKTSAVHAMRFLSSDFFRVGCACLQEDEEPAAADRRETVVGAELMHVCREQHCVVGVEQAKERVHVARA